METKVPLTELTRVVAIYDRIKFLQQEKTAIDLLVRKVASEKHNIAITIDLNAPKENSKKTKLNGEEITLEDVLRMMPPRFGHFMVYDDPVYGGLRPATPAPMNKSTYDIDDVTTLEIMAVLLKQKNREISKLVDELVELGFTRDIPK